MRKGDYAEASEIRFARVRQQRSEMQTSSRVLMAFAEDRRNQLLAAVIAPKFAPTFHQAGPPNM